jgi:hypothetical protein
MCGRVRLSSVRTAGVLVLVAEVWARTAGAEDVIKPGETRPGGGFFCGTRAERRTYFGMAGMDYLQPTDTRSFVGRM